MDGASLPLRLSLSNPQWPLPPTGSSVTPSTDDGLGAFVIGPCQFLQPRLTFYFPTLSKPNGSSFDHYAWTLYSGPFPWNAYLPLAALPTPLWSFRTRLRPPGLQECFADHLGWLNHSPPRPPQGRGLDVSVSVMHPRRCQVTWKRPVH